MSFRAFPVGSNGVPMGTPKCENVGSVSWIGVSLCLGAMGGWGRSGKKKGCSRTLAGRALSTWDVTLGILGIPRIRPQNHPKSAKIHGNQA